VPALPAGAVADEVKRAPVGRKRRLGFPAPGVDGCPQVMGRAPAIALAAGNVYVATPQAIGAVATGEEEVFPIRRNAVGAFIVQLRIDLALQEAGFLPGIVGVLGADEEVLAVILLACKDDGLMVGREAGEIFIGGAVDGLSGILRRKRDRVAHR